MVDITYRRPTPKEYKNYQINAYDLLNDISKALNIEIKNITYKEVINFFEMKFNVLFNYFDSDFYNMFMDDNKPQLKYPNLTNRNDTIFVDNNFCQTCSGLTVPNFEHDRYVIYINQEAPKSRVIFTILHELCHLYFHIFNSQYEQIYVSKTNNQYSDSYPPEILPLEDEANTVASIIFLNDERLTGFLLKETPFKEIMDEVGISESALHNRLMNYLMNNGNLPEYDALDTVLRYRKENVLK